MNEDMSTLEMIDTCGAMLDKLTDAQGRAKCGYITIIDDLLRKIRNNTLVNEAKLNDLSKQSVNNFEPVIMTDDDETVSPE